MGKAGRQRVTAVPLHGHTVASLFVIAALFWLAAWPVVSLAAEISEPPILRERVASGEIPPMAKRLPQKPRVMNLTANGKTPGKYGGDIHTLMARSKDIRMMTVYSYTRLVGFQENLEIVPDVLESFDVEDGRIFTFHLRPGHRWSDGHPLTSEDFRYFWEDVALNGELSRSSVMTDMIVEGEMPQFEVLDEFTVRYSWQKPNPIFLPSLAAPRPMQIFMPAHYMKQFHVKYADPEALKAFMEKERSRNWVELHIDKSRHYRPENPDLPRVDPWINTTRPPSEQFVFVRNPYFHRVDETGRQLPYIDRIIVGISSAEIIPAKTGSGETDLQGRYLRFSDFTFLRAASKHKPIEVELWREGKGSQVALFPNLNTNDTVWRDLFRDVRFRRAMSLAIDRKEINQQFYYGLANPSANTVMPESPLFRPEYEQAWSQFDLEQANKLLDEIGLVRGRDGVRILPDGRPAELIIERAGGSEEADVLELLKFNFDEIGIEIFGRDMPRENLRRRALAGDTLISLGVGMDLGLAVADLPPNELAPTSQSQTNWPNWGNYYDSRGSAGSAPDIREAEQLLELYRKWTVSRTTRERRDIWHAMLQLYSDQVFSIGIVNSALQPIVWRRGLRNIPKKGIFTFAPTAYFGAYHMDTFYFDGEE